MVKRGGLLLETWSLKFVLELFQNHEPILKAVDEAPVASENLFSKTGESIILQVKCAF
jgi:hypothetical protein